MVNDLISDSITRIRNAAMRNLDDTKLLHSKTVEAIVSILKEHGYISDYKVIEESGNKKFIKVILKYEEKGNRRRSVINEITRVSKPGRRVYRKKDEIKSFKNGYGIIIVSTSKGVIDNYKAYREGLGGEVLCTVW
jgi:small subunit ribosomal protein S8